MNMTTLHLKDMHVENYAATLNSGAFKLKILAMQCVWIGLSHLVSLLIKAYHRNKNAANTIFH